MQWNHFLLRAMVALGLAAVLCWGDASRRSTPEPARARWTPEATSETQRTLTPAGDAPAGHWERVGRGRIPTPPGALAAHASALVAMPPDNAAALLAFWFSGDRESAPNVQIAMSALDRATGLWSPARLVVDRAEMGDKLGFGIRRLGNPVAWLDGQGRVHLFVVATGLGGWAAGRIVHLQQRVTAATGQLAWDPVGVLPLSWLWNTSYLVRTAPLPLADGGSVLPVYFELARKFPVALRLDEHGQLRTLSVISGAGHRLQPALLAVNETDWIALMRDSGPQGRIQWARTQNAGTDWQDAGALPLENPNSSVATLTLGQQHFLVYNPQASGRNLLRLANSSDGNRWETVLELEDGAPNSEYSYPAMAVVQGDLWVSYTDQRQAIAWQRLAWVEGASTKHAKGRP